MLPTAMPEMPKRPKPSFSFDRSDTEGGVTFQVGETVTLTLKGRVTAVEEFEEGDAHKRPRTRITVRITTIRRRETEGQADA